MSPIVREVVFEEFETERIANLCGESDRHLRQVEASLGVEINYRGEQFRIVGDKRSVELAVRVVESLYNEATEHEISPDVVHLLLQEVQLDNREMEDEESAEAERSIPEVVIKTRNRIIRPRGPRQRRYMHQVVTQDLVFGIGPAGTGKSYLAVACAVDALQREEVRRLVLVRPAVEAGEKLGFLPGDMSDKIDPYLRPLYDALYEMLGFERVTKLIERNVIEVAPLAFMRGRTLSDAFIILDEAQNTTIEQMKMFLTRIGFGSTAVVTGDVTQVDLPRTTQSGLRHVTEVLRDVDGVGFTFFHSFDVVRHPLVQKIVRAYEAEHGRTDSRD
ncbi:MAG: PhoH family protein [Gammaproteobacteria bacterium]|uniref:PhoH-like protein n=1 Tax=Candidatus Thiopontia autotrophica TaxID=2841688 RepID=A0A8J6P472_9GAMM|nr:PhoH family protein [Candidatus Thiopontia autotrophica]